MFLWKPWLIWAHVLHRSCPRYSCAPSSQVDAVSTDGATPLFNSCSSGSVACVRVLLQHGATINTPSQLASPIHEAANQGVYAWSAHAREGLRCPWVTLSLCCVSPPPGHADCLDMLLSCGARTDVELPAVGTPLYSACVARATDCVMSLLHSGNNPALKMIKTNVKKVIIKDLWVIIITIITATLYHNRSNDCDAVETRNYKI